MPDATCKYEVRDGLNSNCALQSSFDDGAPNKKFSIPRLELETSGHHNPQHINLGFVLIHYYIFNEESINI